jgi:hypothetical protein
LKDNQIYRNYSEPIRRELNTLDERMETARAFDGHATVAEALHAAFPECGGVIYLDYKGIPVWSIDLDDSAVLTRIAVWLRGRNYQIREFTDHPDSGMRMYYYRTLDAGWTRGDALRITANFPTDDETARCQYVQVDTVDVPAIEATTRPVYELRCDDEAFSADLTPAKISEAPQDTDQEAPPGANA